MPTAVRCQQRVYERPQHWVRPYEYVDRLASSAVGELHLGGFTPEEDEATPGKTVLIDTHANPIHDCVWPLYAHALHHVGDAPTPILVLVLTRGPGVFSLDYVIERAVTRRRRHAKLIVATPQ
jgi:uncharacterized protein (UPF0276 family)